MQDTSVASTGAITQSKVALVLEHTLMDLDARSQVEETMHDMLMDLELASFLNKEVLHQHEVSRLQQGAKQTRYAAAERKALEVQESKDRVDLASELCKEMWNLSVTLGELQEWKRKALPKVNQHESLMVELEQLQEEIRILKQDRPAASTAAAPAPAVESDMGTDTAETSPDEHVPKETQETPTADTTVSVTVEEEPAAAVEDTPAAALDDGEETLQETRDHVDDNTTTAPLVTQQEDNDAAVVVALLEEEETPSLAELDIEILNRIFEYLDAFEILRTAQCNISLYSRVDSLFGLAGGGGGETTTESTPPQTKNVTRKNSMDPPAATMVAMPPQPASFSETLSTQTNSAAASPARLLGGRQGGGGGGLFSLLQNRAQPARPYPAAAAAKSAAPNTAEQPALNRNAVNSMADKLTPTELSAIISMTEKLNSREAQVKALTLEKEELAGRLQGTERFKEFLSQKVLSLEKSLRQHQEDQTKVTLQIASDQEVIAFLDGRVQELERNQDVLTDEKKRLSEELQSVQQQNSQKIRVLSDMLQFERERLLENEKDWKATKKLLVKEVKNCRAQIMAAQAERDGYREQNERLKRAVLVNGSGSSRD